MAINKQPVFTTAPILVPTILNPTIVTDAASPGLGNSDEIFYSFDTFGSLIERITVSSTGDTTNTDVTAKLIYLYIQYPSGGTISLYKTAAMPATTISDTTPNAEIEWVFTGGIILPLDYRFLIGASTNVGITGLNGDKLSVTVEGSTYTQV